MAAPTDPRTIGRVPFMDGVARDVYEDADGRPWVTGYDGERIYEVWMMPAGRAGHHETSAAFNTVRTSSSLSGSVRAQPTTRMRSVKRVAWRTSAACHRTCPPSLRRLYATPSWSSTSNRSPMRLRTPSPE